MFYPIAKDKNFGEVKLVYCIMRSKVQNTMNHFQFKVLAGYLNNVVEEIRIIHNEEF